MVFKEPFPLIINYSMNTETINLKTKAYKLHACTWHILSTS